MTAQQTNSAPQQSTPLWDAHLSSAGYSDSPKHGTIQVVAKRTGELLDRYRVAGARRMSTPPEYRCLDQRLDELTPAWSTSVLNGQIISFRNTRICGDSSDAERAVRAAKVEGASWIFLGDQLHPRVAAEAATLAAAEGIKVAAEPGSALPALTQDGKVDSIEGLVGLLCDPELRARAWWEQVTALARESGQAWKARLDPVLSSQAVVVPLLLRTRRRCLLDEAVQAPALAELAGILPYHTHLLGMRNPGGMRFGKKHAAEHIGIPLLDKAARATFNQGWDEVLAALTYVAEQGGRLAGGSGAPNLGVSPGMALHEERALWRGAGVPEDKIEEAFTVTAKELVT
jgi:hypothetical protein